MGAIFQTAGTMSIAMHITSCLLFPLSRPTMRAFEHITTGGLSMSAQETRSDLRFSVVPYMHARWDRVGRKLAFKAGSMSEYQAWRRKTLAKLKELTGYDTMNHAPLKPRITEEKTFDDYVRQRVEIQTEPDVWMPFYVMIPRKGKPPYPAVLAPHGHCSGGKLAVTGCRDNKDLDSTITQHNYDYGIQFARAGLIAFCPDARGFGERQETLAKGNILNSSCQWLNNMGYPLGQTVAGMWAWDLHRLADYVETRKDCVPGRLGCAGLSGGGLQTLWASALDTRIRCAVISGYFYGYRDSLLDLHGNCSCNYVPHLYEYADMGDIAALIAPNPLLIETGTRDPLNGANGLKNVDSQVKITRRAYKLLGVKDLLAWDVFEGEHRWNGLKSIPWLVKHLRA